MNYKFFSKLNQIDVFKGVFSKMVPQLHVKDGMENLSLSSALLGEGEMDFFPQTKLINESGFAGWIILENYYSRLPIRGASDADQFALMQKDIAVARKAFACDGK